MKVLLYSLNYSPELTGIGKYSGEMAEFLAGKGHEVKVITAPPYYPEWQVAEGFKVWVYQKQVLDGVEVIRCPLYVPKKVTTLKRILHLTSFACSSFFPLIKQIFWKPEVVITVQPTLFCTPATLLLGKLSGAKTVLHIQDYEIDAMFGLFVDQTESSKQSKQGFFKSIVTGAESWLMKQFDRVSTISYSMMENASRKGVPSASQIFFPNWVDTDFITPEVDGSMIRERFGFSESDTVILYSGNLGEKQGLELVIEAAHHYRKNEKIKFCIVGQGASKERLVAMANELELENVHFHPLQPYGDLPALLSMANIHLVVQKRGAADVVLPSKLTGILSAGGYSVITAESDTELGRLCNKFPGIAECVEPESLDALVKGIDALMSDSEGFKGVNTVARNYALEYLNKEAVLGRFSKNLNDLVDPQSQEVKTISQLTKYN